MKFFIGEQDWKERMKPEVELPPELEQKQHKKSKKGNRRKENGIKRFNEKCNR